MGNLTSTLTVHLNDDVSGPAGKAAAALHKLGASGNDLKKLAGASTGKLAGDLEKLSKAAGTVKSIREGTKALAKSSEDFKLARQNVGQLTAALGVAEAKLGTFKGVKGAEEQRTAATRQIRGIKRELAAATAVMGEARAAFMDQGKVVRGLHGDLRAAGYSMRDATRLQGDLTAATTKHEAEQARAARKAEIRAGRREAAGTIAAAGGVAAGHLASHGAHASLETYREFDKERRFGRAVMGISDAEQEPLIQQAIHMGASTRYNDVAVMESQRELAARGLKKDQVMGLMEPAANLGQSLDLKLPDAVKQMEGAIFGFKKDISTLEAAQKSATQTADVQVKAAKISGMTPEDISQTYKYGATPARMAGLSEETLLAFAGISKKANMGGDEAGVAFRALVANAMSPTRGAKVAMLANGLDYKNYQRAPDKLNTAAFVDSVKAQYGVRLDKSTTAGLDKIFSDKAMIADPAKFTPAVMKLLSDNLGGDDAKSKKSIAGLANSFRDKSMKGVDTNRLVADLMEAIPKNPALANAIFGSKQGARIANALGDPETFRHMLEELIQHSQGYAEKIAKERQAGFDGAMDRFKGATMNLETAVGRAWDNGGKGGLLTKGADLAGRAVQHLAELDGKALMASTALLGLSGSIGTLAGSMRLAGTFMGLPALTAIGGTVAAFGTVALAATAVAAALYALSDESKGIVHGGKPDKQLNPQDELPGLGSDPDLVGGPSTPGLPRMSLTDGVASLADADQANLPQAIAKAKEEAAGLRKELAEAEAAAKGMAGIDVPGIADAAKAKRDALKKRLAEAEDRQRGLQYQSYGPNLPHGLQPSAPPPAPAAGDAGAGLAKAREELAAFQREYESLKSEIAGQEGLDLPGLSSGMDARKAQLEGLIEGLKAKIEGLQQQTIAPKADTSALDGLGQKFGEIKDKGAEVNALTIRPAVDGSGLGTIIGQLQQIIALGPQASAAAGGVKGPGGGGVRRAVSNNH